MAFQPTPPSARCAPHRPVLNELLFFDLALRDHIPQPVADIKAKIAALETRFTEETKEELDAAWQKVEEIISRNTSRRSFTGDELAKVAAEFLNIEFWNDEKLKVKFELSSVVDLLQHADDLVSKSATSSAHMKLKRRSSKSDSKYLDPQSQQNPLRRIFAPILRKREELPKEMTILLNTLNDTQKRLGPIEKELEQCMFSLPVHIPFQILARHISQTLVPQRSGAELEKLFTANYGPLLKGLEDGYKNATHAVETGAAILKQAGSSQNALPFVAITNNIRAGLTQESISLLNQLSSSLWSTLAREAKEREAIHDKCMDFLHQAIVAEKNLGDLLMPAQKSTEEECAELFDAIRKESASMTVTTTDIVQKIKAVMEQGKSAFDNDIAALNKATASVNFLVDQSQQSQEKILRKVREHLKELHKEQVKHEKLIAEQADLVIQKKMAETCYGQFLQACVDRAEMLEEAESTCNNLEQLLAKVENVAKSALMACSQHVTRTLSEESFRKVRAAQQAAENATQWHRCIGDITALRQAQLGGIVDRMGDSWQLNYLLNHEKMAALESLADCRRAREKVDKAWDEITKYLAEFHVLIPAVSRLDKDLVVASARSDMLAIDKVTSIRASRKQRQGDESPDRASPNEKSELSTLPPIPSPRVEKPPPPPPRGIICE